MLTNIEIGKYLKNIRENKKISLREVERLTNIGYSHLSMVENGKRNVTPALLKNLAKTYGLDYIDLYEKAGYIDLVEKEKINLLEKNDKSSRYFMCPVYGQISAGQPNWAVENIEGRLPLDVNLMNLVNPEEYYFLRVNGESMNNVVRNGAFALIHRQDIVENGDIAVVLVNGYDATLKKFTKEGDVIILAPDSKDSSFTIQVYDQTTSIKILGKYVGKLELNK